MELYKTLSKAILESGMPVSKIAEKSGISRQHIYKIMNGDKNVSSLTLEKICDALRISPASLYNGIIEKKKAGISIPVLGTIPAGIPLEAIEDIIDYEEIPEEMAVRGDYFALKVKGDSMLPTIKENDVVIIRKQEDAETGQICAVMINGYDATLKEVKKEPNGIWVLPHNPNSDFKPTFFSNEEVLSKPVRVIGVAVEIRRSL